MGTGQTAPNPADEVVNFDTTVLNFRYGVNERMNLTAALPYYSIVSDKFQGARYARTNRGLGDLTMTAQVAVISSPQIVLEGGLKIPTGSVDEVDEFNQRICDILSLGSGTWDPIVGASVWLPHVATYNLDVVAGIRHRFTGGANKWGYSYGDQTDFNTHASYKLSASTRVGLRLEGFHSTADTWYGNDVPERGATMLYAGPTVSWLASPLLSVGAFVRSPILMDLSGSQMVAPAVFGLEFSTSLSDVFSNLTDGEGMD